MREITVDSYPIGPTFSSASAAISHAKSYPGLAKAKADEELIVGSQIVDAFWSDQDFVIGFSNSRFLHVFVDPKEKRRNVQWSILNGKPVVPNAVLETVGSPAVLLNHLRTGQPAFQLLMDRSALLDARRGREVKQLFVNEMGYYLYTPQQLILCFFSLYRVDTGENLLYVHEEN